LSGQYREGSETESVSNRESARSGRKEGQGEEERGRWSDADRSLQTGRRLTNEEEDEELEEEEEEEDEEDDDDDDDCSNKTRLSDVEIKRETKKPSGTTP
jgi:hypothetical protein